MAILMVRSVAQATRLEPCGPERQLLRMATCGSSPRASLTPFACLLHIVPFFADLVVIARSLYPIPSRTRPSKSSAPMVLSLKTWKSRSLPGLPRTERFNLLITIVMQKAPGFSAGFYLDRLCVRGTRRRPMTHSPIQLFR